MAGDSWGGMSQDPPQESRGCGAGYGPSLNQATDKDPSRSSTKFLDGGDFPMNVLPWRGSWGGHCQMGRRVPAAKPRPNLGIFLGAPPAGFAVHTGLEECRQYIIHRREPALACLLRYKYETESAELDIETRNLDEKLPFGRPVPLFLPHDTAVTREKRGSYSEAAAQLLSSAKTKEMARPC